MNKYKDQNLLKLLYVDKKLINNGQGGGCYCQFIVDGTITCDGRFDTITSTEDEYFNIVQFWALIFVFILNIDY